MTINTDRGVLYITENFCHSSKAVDAGYHFYFRNYDGNAIYIKYYDKKHCQFALVPPVRTKAPAF